MVARSRNRVVEIFNEAQTSRSSRKNAILLRQNMISTDLDDFLQTFLSSLNRVLVCKKADSNADRIIKFVANFVSLLESEDEENATTFNIFISGVLSHLLRGIESKEKNVRYRICQLLAFLLSSGLSELDEDQFEELERSLIKRVRDRESNVRVQAVIALARFQSQVEDDDEASDDDGSSGKITDILLHILGHDPSSEVRRAALHNIVQSPVTLPFLLERARDQDPVLRRQVYSSILPSINGFKPLSISKRNKLLKWGLRDRDESVRRSADKMFAMDWLNLANGSILELLQRLDIVNSEVGTDAMTAFFNLRPEFIEQSNFDEEFWDELNPESAFLVRCMRNHCVKNKISGDVSDKFPEISGISDLIVKFIELSRGQEEAEKADTEFVIGNLLRLALNADFSDEIGRGRLISNAHEILRSDLNESVLALAVEVLCTISINENELTATIKGIIDDLYDALEDEKEANETFHSANSSIVEKQQSSENSNEEVTVKYIFITLRALIIISTLLQNIAGTLVTNASLKSILNDFIVPAVRSHEGPIREKGIDCLGQICLLDQSLAKDNLDLFLHCFSRGHEELKIQALRIVTDIMMAHPPILKAVPETEESEAAKELGAEFSPEDDLIRIYLKAFQLEDLPEVTATAAISVSKLLLFNIIKPDSPNARGLLKELATLYYSPENVDNQSLRQSLAYFFPVYSFSSIVHQDAMSSVVVPVLKRLAKVYDNLDPDEKADVVALQGIANQLMDWVNPQKLVDGAHHGNNSSEYQTTLLKAILKRLQVCEKEESRVLASSLSKVHIPVENIDEILDALDAVAESNHDMISRRNINKAKALLETRLTAKAEDTMKVEETADETVLGDETIIGDQSLISVL